MEGDNVRTGTEEGDGGSPQAQPRPGLSRIEVQAPAVDTPLIRMVAEALRAGDARSDRLRTTIRSVLGPAGEGNALELFRSDLPDAAFRGVRRATGVRLAETEL